VGMSALILSSGRNPIGGVYDTVLRLGEITSGEISWPPPSGENPVIGACGLNRLQLSHPLPKIHWSGDARIVCDVYT